MIKRAKIDYYKRKIHEAGTDMGKLYFFLNTLVGEKNKELLPENVSDTRLANNFLAFFENKITDICAHILLLLLTDKHITIRNKQGAIDLRTTGFLK